MTAAMFDKVEIVELLLARGADPERRDKGGLSVLELAASMGARQMPEVIARWTRKRGG